MTHDSGDKPLCIVCWLPATRGLPEDGGKLFWCDKHGPFYDKPDSGEREVCGANASDRWPHYETFSCELPKMHEGFHRQGEAYWSDATTTLRQFPADADGVCRTKFVMLPLRLAQRILAGLDVLAEETDDAERAEIISAVAAELRAAVERKP